MESKPLVRIDFLDHCATVGGMSSPIECTVWGILIHEDKRAYYIAHWIAGGTIDDNTDTHTILKSAVKKFKKLKTEKF